MDLFIQDYKCLFITKLLYTYKSMPFDELWKEYHAF